MLKFKRESLHIIHVCFCMCAYKDLNLFQSRATPMTNCIHSISTPTRAVPGAWVNHREFSRKIDEPRRISSIHRMERTPGRLCTYGISNGLVISGSSYKREYIESVVKSILLFGYFKVRLSINNISVVVNITHTKSRAAIEASMFSSRSSRWRARATTTCRDLP